MHLKRLRRPLFQRNTWSMVWNLVEDLVALRMKQITRFVQKKSIHHAFKPIMRNGGLIRKFLYSGTVLFPMSLVTRMGNMCACVATRVVQTGSAKSTNDPCKLDTQFRKLVRTIPPGGLHSSDLQRCTRLSTCGHGDVWNNIGNQHLNCQLPRQPLLETGTKLPRPRRTWDSQIHMYCPWKAYLLVWGNTPERKISALQHEACTSQNMTPCHGTKSRLKVAQAIETFGSRRIQFRLCPSIRATRFSSQPQFDGLKMFRKW